MRASKVARYSWTMFDFANQPFYTLIMTFVFSVYFTDVFIVGADGTFSNVRAKMVEKLGHMYNYNKSQYNF